MVDYKQITTNVYGLTEEGSQIAASGSHEFRVWQACPADGAGEPATVPELKVGSVAACTLGLGLPMARACDSTRTRPDSG